MRVEKKKGAKGKTSQSAPFHRALSAFLPWGHRLKQMPIYNAQLDLLPARAIPRRGIQALRHILQSQIRLAAHLPTHPLPAPPPFHPPPPRFFYFSRFPELHDVLDDSQPTGSASQSALSFPTFLFSDGRWVFRGVWKTGSFRGGLLGWLGWFAGSLAFSPAVRRAGCLCTGRFPFYQAVVSFGAFAFRAFGVDMVKRIVGCAGR